MNLQTATDLINKDRALTVRESLQLTDWLYLEGGADLLPAPTRERSAPRIAYWGTDLCLANLVWQRMELTERTHLCKLSNVNPARADFDFPQIPVIERFRLADEMSWFARGVA